MPCQKEHKKDLMQKDINLDGNWLSGMTNKLKLSDHLRVGANKAVADGCCGDKPYSSATGQCCFGRVISLSEKCCINGRIVSESEECSCSPSQKWFNLELGRVVELTSSIEQIRSEIESKLLVKETSAKDITSQIGDLDQMAGDLEKRFYGLVELEYGDPEAQIIEQEILNESNPTKRRTKTRRNNRIRREYFPDEFIPDYVLDEVRQSKMQNDLVYTSFEQNYESEESGIEYESEIEVNYEGEPDDEEAHIDQVKSIVIKRRNLRNQIVNLVQDQKEIADVINRLKKYSSSLLSIQTPTDEVLSLVDKNAEIEAVAEKRKKCELDIWQENISKFLDIISEAALGLERIDNTEDQATNKFNQEIQKKIHNIHFWHETYDRRHSLEGENDEEELEMDQS